MSSIDNEYCECPECMAGAMSNIAERFPAHKCGLILSHNEHRNFYEPLAMYIEERDLTDSFASAQAIQEAIDADEIWVLQWYPETPIGSCMLAASTLEAVLKMAEMETAREGEG